MIRRGLALFPAALLALAHPLAAGVGPAAQAFVPITACRAVDTRGPAGPNGGPALGANEVRVFTIAGTCGVPANALGLVVNLTVVNPAAVGYAQLFAGDAPVPPTTVLGFNARKTRAGFAFVALASDGSGTVALANGSTGSADYLLDVEGYFVLACTSPILVTNPATAAGAVNSPFSQTFTSSGGVGAKTYTTSSPLPAGLTLAANGTLSGTPTQSGTFPITVTATDQNGCTGTGPTYTLVIACQTITVTNPGVTTGTANTPFSQTFTQSGGVGTVTFSTGSALPIGMTLAASGVLSGTPTQAGGFDIVVTATDANGCTGAGATYHLVINCQTITVTNPATTTGTVNAAFSQTFTQAGAIGSATFSTVSTLPAGLALAANGVLSGTPTQKGTFPIVVKVTDGNLCTGTGATYNLTINCQTIAVSNPATSTATANTPFSQTFTASNTVGTVTFTTASTLPAGLTLAANGVLSGTPTQTGSFPIVVTATDANGCAGIGATYTLVVGCQTWSILPAALPQATSGVAYTATLTQSGGIGAVTYAVTSGTLPAGLGLSSGGVLSGTTALTGSYPFTVTATDANGCTATRDYLLVVSCPSTPITLSPGSLAAAPANAPFPATVFSASGGAGPYTFQLAGALPSGMTFSTDTLSGTPTQTGSFPITISATDAGGCAGSQDYVVTITCNGVTITVAPPSLAAGPVGSPYGPITFTASGGTAPYALAEVGALPPGMTYAAGVLSGTPTQPGTFPVTVTATDANGCTGQTVYSLVTTCPTIAVTNPSTTTGTAGVAFSQQFSQSGGSGTATFSTTSTLPTGLTLAADGTLSGTTSQAGTYPIVVKATDANGCTGTGATYTLVIDCQTITVTIPATTTGTEGNSFSQTFTASGILGTVTWSTASTLPAGVTLNPSTGVLSGTPTETGSFPIVVKATDTNGCFGTSATYTLVLTCPTITVSGTIPALAYNTAMSTATFSQSGTTSTITWSATGLPGGVAINSSTGAVTGTPTATGTFSATITATDAGGCTGSKSVTVTVAPTAPSQSYTGVGNTQVYVTGVAGAPATPAVASGTALLNGVQPLGATWVSAASCSSGGTIATFDLVGRFIFTPDVAATSATCTYTVSSNTAGTPTPTTATASLTFTLSGMVWYVDNATASGTNDGRSSTPLKTMAAVGTASTGSGDFIYVAKGSGSTTGAYAMKTSQRLVGAGATLNVPTVSPILTVAGSAANTPTLSGTLTLASFVNVSGIDMATTTSRAITNFNGSSYATVTGVSVTARTITTTTGTAIDIQGTGNTGVMSFTSVSANGGTAGIVLSNFTGGSFTVTGAGGACGPADTTCSGGTIQNMTGGDDSSAVPVGSGVVLNNVASVSLTRLRIRSNSNYGLRGTSVAGFTMDTCFLDGTTGTNGATPYNDGAVSFDNLTGSATVSNSNIQGGFSNNFRLVNTSGTLNRITFSNVTFDVSGASPANDALTIESQGAAVVNVTVQNSFFKSAAGDLFQLNNIGTGADDLIFTGNTLTNAHAAIATGGGGVTIGSNGTGNITSNFSNNTLRDAVGHAILFFKSTGSATVTGTFDNNTIGVSGAANTGSAEGDGIKVQNAGQGTVKVTITNNQIRQYNVFGIELLTGGGASAMPGALNATITGNTIAQPGNTAGTIGLPKNGIHVNDGTVVGDTYQVCADIVSNSMTGSGADAVPPTGIVADFRLRQRQATTLRLPNYAGANNDNAAAVAFVSGNNGGASGLASNTVPTGGGFTGGAGSCP